MINVDRVINEKVCKHIEELFETKHMYVVKDYSEILIYKDYQQKYSSGDWETGPHVYNAKIKESFSPFYRINKLCLVFDNEDKSSLVYYKAFAIDNDSVEFIKEEVSYIFKDMDIHVYDQSKKYYGQWNSENVRELDAFIKDDVLYAITYLDNEIHKINIKGKVVKSTAKHKTFYSIQNNTVYLNEIVTGKVDKYGKYHQYNNYVDLKSTAYHKDEKEIMDIEAVKISELDCIITDAPEVSAIIVSFTDGTKRLIVRNKHSKKAFSDYFQNIELFDKSVALNEEEFKNENSENKVGWNEIDFGRYFIPGLTFSYTTDNEAGELIVKNDGYIKTRSKKKANY